MLRILLTAFSTFLILVIQAQNIYSEYKWEERDRWQKPEKIIELLAIRAGDVVADIGCHQGYMTVKLSKELGETGLVYAVDIDNFQLSKLKENLRKREITNVRPILSLPDDPKLVANSCDAILILDTYHEIEAYKKVLLGLKNALKPSGRLVICDPVAEARRGLSREQQTARHELDMSYAVQELEEVGFRILSKKDPFLDRSEPKGDVLWAVVAVKD